MGAHSPVRAGDRRGASIAQHVLRQRQDHWALPSGDGELKALVDQFGDALGHVDLRDPLGERGEHFAEIDLLEGLAVNLMARNLADQRDHWGRILEGGVDSNRRVAGAGATGDEQHPGLAGELTIGLGHEGGTAFLPAGNEADLRRVEERIEHFEIAFAGDTEGHVDPVSAERGNDKLAAAEKSLVRRHIYLDPRAKTAI
jgi:hypothetical protein